MGFSNARRVVIAALKEGNYQHEPRAVMAEKNLLAVGDVSEAEVIRALGRASGREYTSSPHHWDPGVEVHVFQPRLEGKKWYIKAYVVEEDAGRVVFVSVHH